MNRYPDELVEFVGALTEEDAAIIDRQLGRVMRWVVRYAPRLRRSLISPDPSRLLAGIFVRAARDYFPNIQKTEFDYD